MNNSSDKPTVITVNTVNELPKRFKVLSGGIPETGGGTVYVYHGKPKGWRIVAREASGKEGD